MGTELRSLTRVQKSYTNITSEKKDSMKDEWLLDVLVAVLSTLNAMCVLFMYLTTSKQTKTAAEVNHVHSFSAFSCCIFVNSNGVWKAAHLGILDKLL